MLMCTIGVHGAQRLQSGDVRFTLARHDNNRRCAHCCRCKGHVHGAILHTADGCMWVRLLPPSLTATKGTHMTPRLTALVYTFSFGGKHPLWHARHPSFPNIIGAGGSAERAGKDWQRTYRLLDARKGLMPTAVAIALHNHEGEPCLSVRFDMSEG